MHSIAPHVAPSHLRAAYVALVCLGYSVRSNHELRRTLRVDPHERLVEVQPELTETHLTAALETALRYVTGCDQQGAQIMSMSNRRHLYSVN